MYYISATLNHLFSKGVDYKRELSILKKQKHPNLVHTYGIFEVVELKTFRIAMELCDCSLRDLHRQQPLPLPMETVADFMTQILMGLSYLHTKKIIHR